MIEKFTTRAQRVLGLARQEAQRTNSEFIGTEHALIALVVEGEGVAAKILKNLGITQERLREESGKLVTPSSSPVVTLGQLPYSPRLKRAFELALEFACRIGSDVIATEHLLIGLVREREGIAYQILLNMNIDPVGVKNRVLEAIGAPPALPKKVDDAPACTRCNGSGKEPKAEDFQIREELRQARLQKRENDNMISVLIQYIHDLKHHQASIQLCKEEPCPATLVFLGRTQKRKCEEKSPSFIEAGTLTCNQDAGHKGQHTGFTNGMPCNWT